MQNPLKTAVETFVTAYAQRDTNTDFPTWLSEQLRQAMPEASESLAGEIIEGVAAYDNTLADLNKAIESGYSKEEWLAERLSEAAEGMLPGESGKVLSQIESSLATSNSRIMNGIDGSAAIDAEFTEKEDANWNEYSVKQKILDVGKQAAVSGLGSMANIIKASIEGDEPIKSAIGKSLQTGLETARCEVKAVVASAVKTTAEKGLTDFLPADTPVETICDMAGAAVESVGALFDAATGKCTMTEALDKASRASFAIIHRICVSGLKALNEFSVAKIPLIGPALAIIGNALLEKLEAPKFAQEMYSVVKNTVVSVWNSIKQKVGGIFNKRKQEVYQ